LPRSFYEYYEEHKEKTDATRVLKGIIPEINCIYLIIDKSLYLWKFMEDIADSEELNLQNIYQANNEQNSSKVFSFGPYDEEIRAVNVCRPSAHVFMQQGIKMLFIIGFVTNIKLYKLLIDEKAIALESLEVVIKIKPEIDMVYLFFDFFLF